MRAAAAVSTMTCGDDRHMPVIFLTSIIIMLTLIVAIVGQVLGLW